MHLITIIRMVELEIHSFANTIKIFSLAKKILS